MRTLFLALFLVLATWTIQAADLSGKWTGTIDLKEDGQARTIPVLLILKQDGSKLTGSGGDNEDDQHPIRKGSVDGENLQIEVEDNDHIFFLNLKVEGDQMTGDIRKDDSAKMKIAVRRSS